MRILGVIRSSLSAGSKSVRFYSRAIPPDSRMKIIKAGRRPVYMSMGMALRTHFKRLSLDASLHPSKTAEAEKQRAVPNPCPPLRYLQPFVHEDSACVLIVRLPRTIL